MTQAAVNRQVNDVLVGIGMLLGPLLVDEVRAQLIAHVRAGSLSADHFRTVLDTLTQLLVDFQYEPRIPRRAVHAGVARREPKSSATDTEPKVPANGAPRRLLRLNEVEDRVRLKRTAIYARIAVGKFPAPRKDGRRVTWFEADIEAYVSAIARNDQGE